MSKDLYVCKDKLVKLTKFLKEKYEISICKQDQIFFLNVIFKKKHDISYYVKNNIIKVRTIKLGVFHTETETFYITKDEIYLTEQGRDFIEKTIENKR